MQHGEDLECVRTCERVHASYPAMLIVSQRGSPSMKCDCGSSRGRFGDMHTVQVSLTSPGSGLMRAMKTTKTSRTARAGEAAGIYDEKTAK